jgi:hypothetical protein
MNIYARDISTIQTVLMLHPSSLKRRMENYAQSRTIDILTMSQLGTPILYHSSKNLSCNSSIRNGSLN